MLIAETDARSVGDSHPSCFSYRRAYKQTNRETESQTETDAN